MTKLSQAFGNSFDKNKDLLRTRTFEMGGHTFKVKVPLTAEYEAIIERLNSPQDEKVKEYYNEITKQFIENKDKFDEELGVVFKENDIEVQGRSMMEAAKNKAITELRIVEMFKLLVPEEGYSLDDLTYSEIEELFPFSIQLDLIEKISDVISPGYKETRGK